MTTQSYIQAALLSSLNLVITQFEMEILETKLDEGGIILEGNVNALALFSDFLSRSARSPINSFDDFMRHWPHFLSFKELHENVTTFSSMNQSEMSQHNQSEWTHPNQPKTSALNQSEINPAIPSGAISCTYCWEKKRVLTYDRSVQTISVEDTRRFAPSRITSVYVDGYSPDSLRSQSSVYSEHGGNRYRICDVAPRQFQRNFEKEKLTCCSHR